MPIDFEKDKYHFRSFEDLIYDAVNLLYLAYDVDQDSDLFGYKRTYIRSSIANSALLFECAANCCIDAMEVSRNFRDDLDKLPFLSKFEMFLTKVRPTERFDRGCTAVQEVAELKSLRDAYVHPKVKAVNYRLDDNLGWCADLGETPILKIPRDPRGWGTAHAVSALRAANGFFNLFFLTWCGFDSDTVCDLLIRTREASIPGRTSYYIDCVGGLNRAVTEWGIDFRFLGKTVYQPFQPTRYPRG